MIGYYILEMLDDNSWFAIREFSCNDLELAKKYLLAFRTKPGTYRLVGVYYV